MPSSSKSIVKDKTLFVGEDRILVGSPAWFEWLATAKKFSFKSQSGNFVAQCETRRNKSYWYAYRRAGKLLKVYLGKAEELTLEKLEQASISLSGQTLLKQFGDRPAADETGRIESRIDTSVLPLTKVNAPALPRQLLARPRLTRQIHRPLTVIYAPSGFGKSTLLNEWRQSCGHAVAWLSLDESDNDTVRFWYSVAMALQMVNPDLGKELLSYLSAASPVQLTEMVSRLTNEIVRSQDAFPHLSLVLDDFQHIHHTEIYDSLQGWIEQLSPNMQLVILSHTNPPLSLGHLRARGLLTELDASDLRFTLEEGISYLRQGLQGTELTSDDLARLVKHTEGWAAGLTLTALALGKQEDHHKFVETFSGAHIYMREYFMETVLQRSSPDVQAFLVKTAILKQLTGSLCDAVTGQHDGDEMLARLWHDNLFIVRLEEQGWYRYHDLFAEMLLSQLQAHFPEEIPQLHRRAAQWYRTRSAPADAIYHLLATEAWEEAALLMEEMALRELEQYGEDSRLLRWLQELPAGVVQKHKRLLAVYLRLAQVALPKQKMERFISQMESNLSNKSLTQQTEDERDVLVEIQQLRRFWDQDSRSTPPLGNAVENDTRWELLNGMRLLRQGNDPAGIATEAELADLLHRAQTQRNLFIVLMAGGALARRALNNGQLRRSEKIARQILEQALAQRGQLPEPASIALATLAQVHLERNELALAQNYLAQALEVDPNPTSTNMIVQLAILSADLQIASGNFSEALVILQSIRDLHLRRPSGLWSDADLLMYEAQVHVRQGDLVLAQQRLQMVDIGNEMGLGLLVRAEVSLLKEGPDVAEAQLRSLLQQYPNGLPWVSGLHIRLLLAQALFDQHRMHQALQLVKDAVRLAASEQFIRPFLDAGVASWQLLSLALQSESLTRESQVFVREVLRLCKYESAGNHSQTAQADAQSLAIAASISTREQEVLCLLSDGHSNRAIAEKLSVSESTVKTHVGNIYTKLNVNSRVQAITYAKELKLI